MHFLLDHAVFSYRNKKIFKELCVLKVFFKWHVNDDRDIQEWIMLRKNYYLWYGN